MNGDYGDVDCVGTWERTCAELDALTAENARLKLEVEGLRAEMENCAKIADIIEVCTPNARPEARAIARQLRAALGAAK